jgi:hypothetical protein
MADRITVSSEVFAKVERDASEAGSTFAAAASGLSGSIPGDAFGALGGGLASAGNTAAAALGAALAKLESITETLAEGSIAASSAFEQIDEQASARFGAVEADG